MYKGRNMYRYSETGQTYQQSSSAKVLDKVRDMRDIANTIGNSNTRQIGGVLNASFSPWDNCRNSGG